MNKNGIIALTKGYKKNEEYKELISRNKSIYDVYYSKLQNKNECDIVLYHEGNITNEQQKWIQEQTPNLPLIFKEIEFINFNETDIKPNNKYCHLNDRTKYFPNGYKNMCHFWSVDLFKYTKEYDYIIRIDEDCIIKKLSPTILSEYKTKNIYYSSPYYQGYDAEDFTMGMEQFFQDINNGKKYYNIRFPYTNLFIMYVPYFLKNTKILEALSKINDTQCIFINRWGDLPIWGYLLKYYVPQENHIEDKNIAYVHGSHHANINLENIKEKFTYKNNSVNVFTFIFLLVLIISLVFLLLYAFKKK
jgi:hypothetical protein